MDHPPIVPHTLVGYMNHFAALRNREPDDDERPTHDLLAARFSLTGITSDDSFLAGITTTPDLLAGSNYAPYIRRDLDSVLGYSANIPVLDAINYFPYPNVRRTLEKRLRLTYKVAVRGEWISLDPGTVPNVQFAKFGHRHSVRMFFPGLTSEDRDSLRLKTTELQSLYDYAMRPAAQATLPDIVHDWPATFSTAEFKDRNARSGFSHSSYIIPEDRLKAFSDRLRRIINQDGRLEWAKDFFWGVEIRGVKDVSSHPIDAPEWSVHDAYNSVLRQVDTTDGIWFGDVGLEFILHDQALLWTTNGHQELLEHLLFLSPEEANRAISNSRCFFRDTTTHIKSLSGFRADFSKRPSGGIGPLSVSYVQAYQTDKQQTYHPEGSRFTKTLTGKLAVQGSPPPWCESLLQVFRDAGRVVNVATRFEARMPLPFINEAFRVVKLVVIQRTIVCYKRELWWDFRCSKLWSATLLLSMINSDNVQVRRLKSSLTLVGALVYFINSLHSRPDDGSYARKLCQAIFPLTRDTNSPDLLFKSKKDPDGQGLPYAIGGVMHLLDILLKPIGTTYRFSEIKLIDEDVFNYAVGCLPEDVTAFLFKVTIQRHGHLPGYIPQRKGVTKRRAPRQEEEEMDRQFPELEGIVEEVVAETAEGCAAPPEEIHIGDVLEKILQQYASDIMQKCGNKRGQGPVTSFCPLVQYERQHLNIDDINTLDVGRLFTQVQWRLGTPDDWENTFDRLFPDVHHIDHFYTSHFGSCRYYTTYREVLQKLPDDRGIEVRALLQEKIAELAWLPATKSDRLWDYSMGDESWIKVPNPNERGPKILVNRRIQGRVHHANNNADEETEFLENLEQETRRVRHIALREEEEENSSDDDRHLRRSHSTAVQVNHTSRTPNSNRPPRGRNTQMSHRSQGRARSHASPVRMNRTFRSPTGRSNANASAAQNNRMFRPPNSNRTSRGRSNANASAAQINPRLFQAGPSRARSNAPVLNDEDSDGWSPPPVHRAFDQFEGEEANDDIYE